MILNLRAMLGVATALTAIGAALSVPNVAFADDIARTPPSLYSPVRLAEQSIKLQTFAATAADYFGAPIYGPSGPATHFDGSQETGGQSAAPTAAPAAWLALRG
jgi:hypothetical protein